MQVSEEYFSKIVNETKEIVLAAIRKHLFEHYAHAIDDVVQETYLRAYKSLVKDKFQDKSKISTWLYVIAKNESLRMNSKLKREEQKRDLFEFFSRNIHVEENEVNDNYNINEITGKISLLPLKYRSILMMHYEGVSESEIAGKLSIPQGTVKSRLHRGKRIMCVLMKQGGGA